MMAIQQTLLLVLPTNPNQGTLIRGINVKDNLLTEGVDADTLNGLTAAQIQAS